jgi:hypothetical protein
VLPHGFPHRRLVWHGSHVFVSVVVVAVVVIWLLLGQRIFNHKCVLDLGKQRTIAKTLAVFGDFFEVTMKSTKKVPTQIKKIPRLKLGTHMVRAKLYSKFA